MIVLPRPDDDRDIFDFSDSLMLIEEAHRLAARFLDAGPAVMRPPRPLAAGGGAAATASPDAVVLARDQGARQRDAQSSYS